MRALITGGNGFVGRHLSAHLREHGDTVVPVDLPLDVADAVSMRNVFEEHRPDVVYHLAALAHVGTSWDDPTEVLRVNVLGTSSVIAAARGVVPDAAIVVASSAEVYGIVTEHDLPLSEITPAAPVSPYAASKLAAEVVALQAARAYGQRVMIARPFNHVGPGQSAQFFVPAIASRMLTATQHGDDHITVGNLTTRRDFTDVRDVVRAYRLLSEHGVAGEIYNIARGVDVAMQEVADELRSLINPALRFIVDESLLRPVDVPVLRGDASKLSATTSWTPTVPWSETLRDIVDDLRSASEQA